MSRSSLSAARLRRLLGRAATRLRARGELALVLTGDREIRRLNARYRGKHEATGVPSFPGEGGALGLGDVVISVETAARNAKALGRSLLRELDVLALHGLLHALGYDHERDLGEMDSLERRLHRQLGVEP